MKNTVVLEMINDGKIDRLKELLQEEIYKDSLKGNGNSNQRYSAMKRFFKYGDASAAYNPDSIRYPCLDVEIGNEVYNSFCDSRCFALTTENIGTINTFDKSKYKYFDMNSIVNFDTESKESLNLNRVLADAKSKGYQYKKSEFEKYFIRYKDTYYRVELLDKAYSIVNDGELAEVYYNGKVRVLLIKTSIGIAGVMPIRLVDFKDEYVIIDVH